MLNKMAVLPPLSKSLISSDFHVLKEGFKCSSSSSSSSRSLIRRNTAGVLSAACDSTKRAKIIHTRIRSSMADDHERRASQQHSSGSTGKHQRGLETYLQRLQNVTRQVSSGPEADTEEGHEGDQLPGGRKDLSSLDRYLDTVTEDTVSSEVCKPSTSGRNASEVNLLDTGISQAREQGVFRASRYKRSNISSGYKYDERDCGNLYLIGTLVAINVAVFLFEIASPIKSGEYELYSLPMMYGAKVNDLIVVGEWWRLATPMFLHSGLLHVALSSWVLLSFGPLVCRQYGPFTFVLIYVLGGLSGNFSSFLHTSDPTVGGSGPVFAVIGAWLVYQIQNKDTPQKELSEAMFQRAMIATALSFLLGNFGPLDNWTSLGAVVSGIVYGYLTCPVLQVDSSSSTRVQERMEEGVMLAGKPSNPCKSLFIFTVLVSLLTTLVFFAESPLEQLELNELIEIIE